MRNSAAAIHELSLEVQAQIQGTIEINCIRDVIDGLVKNALDANASGIIVRANIATGYCSVQDNGRGIARAEFLENGQLARMNCTSRTSSNELSYGTHGRFLACLSAVAMVSIISQQANDNEPSRLFIHPSRTSTNKVHRTGTPLISNGTVVTVHNLFRNYPVRFKRNAERFSLQNEIVLELDRIKYMISALLLAWSKVVSIYLRVRSPKGELIYRSTASWTSLPENLSPFDMDNVVSIIQRANLTTRVSRSSWRAISVKSGFLWISAAVSLTPVASRSAQFMSFGHLPLDRNSCANRLFDLIENKFTASSFGLSKPCDVSKVDKRTPRPSSRHIGSRIARIEKWPVYFVRIDINPHGPDNHKKTLAELISRIEILLESLMVKFLDRYGYNLISSAAPRSQHSSRLDSTNSAFRKHARLGGRGLMHEKTLDRLELSTGLPFVGADRHLRVAKSPASSSPIIASISGVVTGDISPLDTTPIHDPTTAIEWTDPQSGITLQLNSDTGAELPSKPTLPSRRSIKTYEAEKRRQYFHNILQPDDYAMFQITEQPIFSTANLAPTTTDRYPRRSQSASKVHCDSDMFAPQLGGAQVIGQVDRKYILILLPFTAADARLILVDQHAADERVKLEMLCEKFCHVDVCDLSEPLVYGIEDYDARQLETSRKHLEDWGVFFEVQLHIPMCPGGSNLRTTSTLTVTALPDVIAERCRLEPKLLIDLLLRDVWSQSETAKSRFVYAAAKQDIGLPWWVQKLPRCPAGFVELLNSRACRSAVMFNDVLDLKECKALITRLSQTVFPMRCAHGRPTMVELMNTTRMECLRLGGSLTASAAAGGFKHAWSSWMNRDLG